MVEADVVMQFEVEEGAAEEQVARLVAHEAARAQQGQRVPGRRVQGPGEGGEGPDAEPMGQDVPVDLEAEFGGQREEGGG